MNRDASMSETFAHSGTPGGVTFFQVAPPSVVSCTSPSSVPIQIWPARIGDGAMVKITS